MSDTTPRFDSRTIPFSLGGSGDRTAGALIPEGPDPLYNVSIDAPDLKGLPWDRRTYDAWTTPEFRALALAWLVDMIAANPWMYFWRVREKATQARLSTIRLEKPLLIVVVTRRADAREFEMATDWTSRERDDAALVNAKLAVARTTLEALNAQNPP
jgi:hypothetical protein